VCDESVIKKFQVVHCHFSEKIINTAKSLSHNNRTSAKILKQCLTNTKHIAINRSLQMSYTGFISASLKYSQI